MIYIKTMKSIEYIPVQENVANRKEDQLNRLYGSMELISERTNAEVGFELMKKDGTVDPEALGGMSEEHKQFSNARERAFAKIDDPLERKRFATTYKIDLNNETKISGQMFEDWQKKKHEAKSAMLEMLVTTVFYKALGNDYLVVRSSAYDDYKNGVDLIIVNKKTGEVIGTFDEVHDRKMGDRTAEKNQKIIKQAKKGGVNIEYCPTIENGKIKKQKRNNIPNFYLLLTIDELEDALKQVDYDNIDNLSKYEQKLFTKFASSIMQQAEMLSQQEGIAPILMKRLNKVSEFFAQAA